jgi:peroxiredoxin
MRTCRISSCGTLAACLLLTTTTLFAAESDLPRYWLKVGQELSYRTTSEFSTADGQAIARESTWQVWVVKQNTDGSWRLILRHALSFQVPSIPAKPQPAKAAPAKSGGVKPATGKPATGKPATGKPATGKPTTSKPIGGKPSPKPQAEKAAEPSKPAVPPPDSTPRQVEQITFAYCDLSPDGAIAPNPTLGFQFEPRQVLLKLPKTKSQLDKGWTDVDNDTQVSYRYRVDKEPDEDDDEPTWKILGTRQSPIDDIYLLRSQSTFTFGGDRGIVERVQTKLEQGYGLKGSGVITTELSGLEQFDAAWCKKLDEEMAIYFVAQRRYQALLDAAQRNSADAETLLIDAGAILQHAAGEITLPVVKEDLGKQIAQHAAMIGLTARAARDRADLIDQPAPTWQSKDLQGKAHALRDYKGKVVVLHFWRRSDLWSLRVLPPIEQIAEQFADKPVAVLGMNSDTREEDARFVADRMGLAYPILRADKFAERYNAATTASVVVVDQKGIVRDVFLGFTPTLRQDVAKVISALIADAKGD